MPAMIRRIKPGWAIGLPALGAVIAFIVLAGACDRTWNSNDISFKYPARARISVHPISLTCEEEAQHECSNPQIEIYHESSGSSLWIDMVTGAEWGRSVRTGNGADPADVNAMFDLIAETVRIKESGNQ